MSQKMVATLTAALALSMASASAAEPTCAPPTLTKIVTRNTTPGVDPTSFAGQPLVTYRLGGRNQRVEEAPDRPNRLHQLIVVAEPDIWMINLVDRTGHHIVDPGPTFDVHAPVIARGPAPALFSEMEFGCEAQFVRKNAPHPKGEAVRGGRRGTLHVLEDGPHRLEVLLDAKDHPIEVAYVFGGRPALVVTYVSFEDHLVADPRLFQRPSGITYQEARPR